MKKIKILKEDGHIIPVILEVPEEADSVVIMIHGFTSCKECPTGELLLRRMPEAGIPGLPWYTGKKTRWFLLSLQENSQRNMACRSQFSKDRVIPSVMTRLAPIK